MGDQSLFPVYTPTPIRLLNGTQRRKKASRSPEIAYTPTPINELYRYAPDSFQGMYSPAPSSWASSEVPAYSPVVPTQTPVTPNQGYDFSLPSISYLPPLVEEKDVFAKPASPLKTKKPSTNIEDADNCPDSEEKRKKILSLYSDLYENAEAAPSKPTKITISAPRRTTLPIPTPPPKDAEQSSPNEPKNLPQSRPKQPLRPSGKIPMPIRIRYLDQFVEACIRISPSNPEAYSLALKEEQACHDRAQNRLAYLNSVINTLKMLKSQPAYVAKPAPSSATASDEGGSEPQSAQTSSEEDLDELVRGPSFYHALEAFLLSEEELVSNGFPRLDTSENAPRGKAVIRVPDNKKASVEAYTANKRVCCRCGQVYEVNKFGEVTVKRECVYHWGKPVGRRVPGSGFDLRYTCCQAESGAEGCEVASAGHVHSANKWCDLEGYISSLPPAIPPSTTSPGDRPVNVYAVDCEMVYTTGGCELGRVTVVDTNLNVVLDKIVRPLNPIVDANTRFSGLTLDQLAASTTQIMDVQMELLHLWDEDTILIGHSLESDLMALKFIHSKVVDTSVVFPHRRGPPYKRALKTIVGDYLDLLIQDDEAGHDSKEDAIACMLVMQKKVKAHLQRKKIRKIQ
ncbi:unnamed protein product [Mesocestoides corti]|uniref:Exonuclease domain-containing protein n=2 Tax=Mesocestoides corti TaxID=53468 RepID=A0A0R3UHP1_MESCO|nr:unnamed protein product [Mesocestoides corti]